MQVTGTAWSSVCLPGSRTCLAQAWAWLPRGLLESLQMT